MHDAHPELRVPLEQPAQEQSCYGDRRLRRPAHDIVQQVGAEIDPGQRVERMEHDQAAQPGRLLPEGIEVGIRQVDIAHPGSDLNTHHPQLFHCMTQLGRRRLRTLKGNGADSEEPIRMGCGLSGKSLVEQP